ncbi:MAG: hypothetical protein IJN34_08720 [Clostridia bacterium]|nr:hypothetical protein [Clostridia bacterium]
MKESRDEEIPKHSGYSALSIFSAAPSGKRKNRCARDFTVRNTYRGVAAAATNDFS